MRILLIGLLHVVCVPLFGQNLPNIVYILADDLEQDPGERQNLVSQHPEMVETLKTEMIQLIRKGRSTLDPDQENEGEVPWEQVRWAYSL
jgi:hypothetical protein